ncbi:hypothetical protein DFH09DRAFT_1089944 [Mycena vulgaris]|nr:hypothetical protein DFH09DRAFT_1089944 [Mycena vulgaris]
MDSEPLSWTKGELDPRDVPSCSHFLEKKPVEKNNVQPRLVFPDIAFIFGIRSEATIQRAVNNNFYRPPDDHKIAFREKFPPHAHYLVPQNNHPAPVIEISDDDEAEADDSMPAYSTTGHSKRAAKAECEKRIGAVADDDEVEDPTWEHHVIASNLIDSRPRERENTRTEFIFHESTSYRVVVHKSSGQRTDSTKRGNMLRYLEQRDSRMRVEIKDPAPRVENCRGSGSLTPPQSSASVWRMRGAWRTVCRSPGFVKRSKPWAGDAAAGGNCDDASLDYSQNRKGWGQRVAFRPGAWATFYESPWEAMGEQVGTAASLLSGIGLHAVEAFDKWTLYQPRPAASYKHPTRWLAAESNRRSRRPVILDSCAWALGVSRANVRMGANQAPAIKNSSSSGSTASFVFLGSPILGLGFICETKYSMQTKNFLGLHSNESSRARTDWVSVRICLGAAIHLISALSFRHSALSEDIWNIRRKLTTGSCIDIDLASRLLAGRISCRPGGWHPDGCFAYRRLSIESENALVLEVFGQVLLRSAAPIGGGLIFAVSEICDNRSSSVEEMSLALQ